MRIDLHHAQALLSAEGLGFPALPGALAAQLRERAPGIYSTAELVAPPYALEVHVGELLRSANPGDSAVVALDGHGSQSWAFHHYLVSGPLALFVQLPWAGAFSDMNADRAEIERVLEWARTLPQRLAELDQQGRLAPGQKLLVVLTRFSRPRWAWVQLPAPAAQEVFWQSPARMLGDIDAELAQLSETAHS